VSGGARRKLRRKARRAGSLVLCTGLALLGASTAADATPTHAAATAPFPCQSSKIYLAQGNTPPGSALYQSLGGPGNVTFNPVGMTAGGTYNAIGLNPVENLIYGVVTAAGGSLGLGHLVEVDSNGVTVDRGPLSGESTPLDAVHTDAGAFDGVGRFYTYASAGDKVLHVIDVNTNPVAEVTEKQLTGTLPADVAFVGAYLWGYAGQDLVRIDPATGVVTTFPKVLPDSVNAAAAWTYGNGNLGLQDTASGVLYQLHITAPADPKPLFTLISTATGPLPQGQTDGTACAGRPVDLGVRTASKIVGGTITWTVTVHNFGQTDSSGFAVTDLVPTKVTDLDTDEPGCDITGQTLSCMQGTLIAGQDQTITFTGSTPVDGSSVTTNPAVVGNESDHNRSNDTATNTTPRQGADLALLETVSPDHVKAGDPITWSLTVHNRGPGNSSGFTITDPLPHDVNHLATTTPGCGFDDHTLTCKEGPLPLNKDFVVTFTGTAPESGRIDNTAIVTGRDPDPNHANDSATARVHVQRGSRPSDPGEAGQYIPKQPGEHAGHDRRARDCSRRGNHGACKASDATPSPETTGRGGNKADPAGLGGLVPSATPPGTTVLPLTWGRRTA
jgi:uncharacterized repeat protein (TIGR01451 family)